ncbi:Apolipoprotein D-like protein [Hapsidospora chrysogenum ATCC 11550]|uniref:Apolipoprotein D-like protein n=1 Tax=Hapsidospora chrysogenum (strain ATCC 11550 / CBS 779.69 / DSM 880 / IAM 14645 / JCM 23072 / IMI 49137) TaxID=857340 RepID=A0A086T5I5_HAPC1|nr:Apolipoprotein D-like protein [Hapsidospora chrysogenum ATCC 11550]
MRPLNALHASASTLVLAAAATNNTSPPSTSHVVPSLWDGSCYYPISDPDFHLDTYLGRWYQVAGTLAPFTRGCKCIHADYALNDNGTVRVKNGCERDGQVTGILGAAAPADPAYGADGVFRVQFPGQPAPDCPGPNYIVQDYTGDMAIVQSNNFTTLFILSREQFPEEAKLDDWIERAGLLGANLDEVAKTDQTDCVQE